MCVCSVCLCVCALIFKWRYTMSPWIHQINNNNNNCQLVWWMCRLSIKRIPPLSGTYDDYILKIVRITHGQWTILQYWHENMFRFAYLDWYRRCLVFCVFVFIIQWDVVSFLTLLFFLDIVQICSWFDAGIFKNKYFLTSIWFTAHREILKVNGWTLGKSIGYNFSELNWIELNGVCVCMFW